MSDLVAQFVPTVKTVFSRWKDFDGRSARSEYWLFALFCVITNFLVGIIAGVLGDTLGSIVSLIVSLGLFVPSLSVAVRRLHDTDRSGWWFLIALIPILGLLVFIYFAVQKGTTGPNRFGADPLAGRS